MDIRCFDDLLAMARTQTSPQRLLLLFAGATLADDASQAEREAHAQGRGGQLEPLACVDKHLHELSDFKGLVEEARAFVPAWALLFVAALSGQGAQGPTDAETDQALQRMVASLRQGQLGTMLAFDAAGEVVRIG